MAPRQHGKICSKYCSGKVSLDFKELVLLRIQQTIYGPISDKRGLKAEKSKLRYL